MIPPQTNVIEPNDDYTDLVTRDGGRRSSLIRPELVGGTILIVSGSAILSLPFWLRGDGLFSSLLPLNIGAFLFLVGVCTVSDMLPEGSRIRNAIQKPLASLLGWWWAGMMVGQALSFMALFSGFAVFLVYVFVKAGAALLVAADVPDATVEFLTYAIGLLAIAYASPWALFLPATALYRWFYRKAEDDLGANNALLIILSAATRIDFRQLAYVLGTAGLFVTMTLGTVPEGQRPEWAGSVSVTAQALLLFIAVDQYLATFHQTNVLDRMRAAHHRALARALRLRPGATLESSGETEVQ